jgi:predicted ArsR family transcriptional regulator
VRTLRGEADWARDIAEQIGITERAAQRILADLITDAYITRTKGASQPLHDRFRWPSPPPDAPRSLGRAAARRPHYRWPAATRATTGPTPSAVIRRRDALDCAQVVWLTDRKPGFP